MKGLSLNFAEVIAQRLKALNTNAFAVEQAAGLPPDAIRNVIRSEKKDGPTLARAQAICEALGLEFNVGAQRKDSTVQLVTVDGADYVSIPVHDAVLSAGAGSLNDEAAIIGHLSFRHDWLIKVGVSPNEASMARVSGDSMAPGIQSGDLVLIDNTKVTVPIRKRLKGSKVAPIFAFVQDGEARVKRIERPEARLLVLMSDNPSYPTELVTDPRPESIRILGQVVWSGHVWR